MNYLAKLILVLAVVSSDVFAIDSLVVKTKTGSVRGTLIHWPGAKQDVYQFTAIPFAEPPIGDRRFKKPVPKTPWSDVLNATSVAKSCIQIGGSGDPNNPYVRYTSSLMIPGVVESEDCLYLNIWVPRATLDSLNNGNKTTKQLSVYVYIHGGSFISGTTMWKLFNGTVMSGVNNIILATIQYRLGVFGFGYFGKNDDAPGNVGLWDQMEAMKWISENIGSFGGNSSEVTVGGESAGAACVAFHLLSPRSRNYFQKAIIESGSAIAPWAFHTPETAKTITDIVLSQANCSGVSSRSSITDKVRCLRSISATDLGKADVVPMGMGYVSGSIPVIDGDFVPRNPIQMMASGDFYKVPLLIGANKDEGMHLLLNSPPESLWLLPDLGNPNATLDRLNLTNYDPLWQFGFIFVTGVPMPQGIDPLLSEAIHLHYWPTRQDGFPHGAEILQAAGQITGDYALACPTYSWANITATFMQANNAPVYVYRYTHRPLSAKSASFFPEWLGVMHGSELLFVFGEPLAQYAQGYGYSLDDRLLSKTMLEYWGNFIKYGDPNIRDRYSSCDINSTPPIGPSTCSLRNWPPFNGQNCTYQITELGVLPQVYNYGDAVSCGFKVRDCTFWGELFPKLSELINKNSNGTATS